MYRCRADSIDSKFRNDLETSCHNQMALQVTVVAAMYLASMVKSATIGCFLAFQVMATLPILKT